MISLDSVHCMNDICHCIVQVSSVLNLTERYTNRRHSSDTKRGFSVKFLFNYGSNRFMETN